MSAIREAFVAQMAASVDPFNGTIQDLGEKTVEKLDAGVVDIKAKSYISLVKEKHSLMETHKLDEEDIAGFKRLQARASS